MIFIYKDAGVSDASAAGFMTYFGGKARYVSGLFLRDPAWIKAASLLIIPGGRSLPYYEALGDAGNQNIVDFVKQGGSYLGICAGAYYAAAKTTFASNRPEHTLILDGALYFFEGEAIGPVFAEDAFDYESEAGARLVSITWGEETFPVYFNGGCSFTENLNVMARFSENSLPAILGFNYGKGRVLLSGVHPELDYQSIPDDDAPQHQYLRQTLREADAKRRELLVKLIAECYPNPGS